MKLGRMLALTLVLMTLMTAALAADDPGLYYSTSHKSGHPFTAGV